MHSSHANDGMFFTGHTFQGLLVVINRFVGFVYLFLNVNESLFQILDYIWLRKIAFDIFRVIFSKKLFNLAL